LVAQKLLELRKRQRARAFLLAPNSAHDLEPAFVNRGASDADINQRADRRLAQASAGNARFQLGNAGLQKLLMQRVLARLARGLGACRINAEGGLKDRGTIDRKEALLRSSVPRVAPVVQGGNDLLRQPLLPRQIWIVLGSGGAVIVG